MRFDPALLRTELALSIAADPRPLRDRAERFLRANVRERIDHGSYSAVAEYVYVASVAGLPGTPTELLARAPHYARP